MPKHPFAAPRGRLETFTLHSDHLADNLLGDPPFRSVAVYLPEGHDEAGARYPVFVSLAPYSGSGLKQLAWRAFEETLPQRVDRLVAEGKMGPVILVMPDGFTSLGGNQYVDSLAMGRWERFLVDELLPAVDARYKTLPGAAHRAVFGRSSGGYGALIQGLRHAGRWGAVACQSGDMAFELVYRPDFPAALTTLARHGGDLAQLFAKIDAARQVSGGELHALMPFAMGASYDPDPAAPRGARLPVTLDTCELIPERWAAWLAHDPVELVRRPELQDGLRRLRGLFIDVGSRDEYALQYGARRLTRLLDAAAVPHRYEEYDDGHRGTDYRFDVSLPFLYAAVGG